MIMKPLKSVTLEMSLKPFRSTGQKEIEAVCFSLFDAWRPLVRHADRVCVMLWTADGSEILDYTGRDEDEIEWCRYIGGANPLTDWDKENDPRGEGLHTRWYYYTDNPPVFQNKTLRRIIATLKRVGTEVTGKPVLVGETFDPGPEFAKSDFKYKRHNEICIGDSMGRKSMVCCYGVLNGDSYHYAAYPDGIPDGTPFGTFFGRQAQRFLTDMGFDYLWLSNGFGFGTETWGVTGATFDGEKFYPEKIDDVQGRIMEFWRLFRQEFRLPVETRGTNLTAGIDFATDAVNLKKIYEGGFDILPPPNSPWAALDGDFGLELAGYMSRMAELPSSPPMTSGKTPDSYLFRFYIHDPWWMNSPWMDRYEGQPHDIYLPLAVTKINSQGKTVPPDHMNFLTVDNSLGEMPESCANEVIPHLLKCFETAPDQPSPFVWVYPFREYHENADAISKAFFEEWFLIKAINSSLPVNTVVSSDRFVSIYKKQPDFLKNSVLVVPVPDRKSALNQTLFDFIRRGGRVMLYGSLTNADAGLLKALDLNLSEPLFGEMQIEIAMKEDVTANGEYPNRLVYYGELSDGGVDTVPDGIDPAATVLAGVNQNGCKRVVLSSVCRSEWNGGGIVWCRGYSCSRAENDTDMYPLARLFTLSAGVFGFDFKLVKQNVSAKEPVITLHRNRNLLWVSGYNPDTTTDIHLKTPLGAPLLIGYETMMKDGCSVYRLPRAWRNECRVFVRQRDGGVLGCRERAPVSFTQRHKLEVNGLKNADVYVLPLDGDLERTELLLNSEYPHVVGEPMEVNTVDTVFGRALRVRNVTGSLQISDLTVE